MKKTLSLILALLMSISCASFVAADDAIADENAAAEAPTPYDEAILFLQDNKIMQGYEDGLIHAEKPVERYMMALLNARISTGWTDNTLWEDDIANDSGYTDLAGTVAEDYYGAISYADQKGIVEGYPDGSFKPEQQVTYREALAMATRTLGYTGLEWPWGNIEKAVNLGLTEGIEDVAYTTPLNRGQVAQIIYNTLFAKVNGETLAMNIFGIDRAWETILVTADSRSTYIAGAEKTAKAGQVAFQIINKDGSLDDEIYYVADATLEIGHPYRALFNVDEASELVELVKAVECKSIVEDNEGLTDNEGKAYADATPVNTLLDKYYLVDKYDIKTGLANNKFADKSELILVDAINMGKVIVTGNSKYAFELATGNVVTLDEEGNVTGIKWYYSDLLDCYFEKIAVSDTNADNVVNDVYDIVDDGDVKDLLADLYYTYVSEDANVSGFTLLTKVDKTAYSHVEIWDVEGKAYGWYEAYRLGVVSATTLDECYCDEDAEEDVAGWKFTGLNAGDINNNDKFGKAYVLDSECDKCVGYVVESAIDLANAKYVIYGVNEATKTIKVIKEVEKLTGDVEDLTDMDTYYATGIVRGYRMSKGTVTIGEQNIPYGYDSLVGNAISIKNDGKAENTDHREAYSEWFAGLVNQYVEYVVVDGKIVYIEVVGAKSDEWIVVENYIGISSDGYIVVGGYSTSNLKYEMFRIASYDGWKQGDKFWYGQGFDRDFDKGTIYQITSYDATTDTYNVKNVELEGTQITIESEEADGYRWIGNTAYEMKDTDKYIIIANTSVQTMPILVYEGKLPAEWTVTADLIVGAADKGTLILANVDFQEDFFGFDLNAYQYSMVVVLDKVILDWVYDGYGTEYDWYIQGAAGYKMEAFNLYTGNFTTVYGGYNLDIEKGAIYAAIDGVITQDVIIDWAELDNHYEDLNRISSTYVIIDDMYADIDTAEKLDTVMSGVLHYSKVYNVVDDATYYYVTFNEAGRRVTSIEKLDAAKHLAGKIGFEATVIYDNESKDAIIYVYEDTGVVEVKPTTAWTAEEEIVQYDEFWMNVNDYEGITINAQAKYTSKVEDNEVVGYTISAVKFFFDAEELAKISHANLSKWGYNFGKADHDFTDYTFAYRFGNDKFTVSLADLTLEVIDCDDCDLVVAVEVPVNKYYSIDDLGAEYPAANHSARFFKFQMINNFAENEFDDDYTLDATGIFGLADGKVTFTDVDTYGDGYDNTDYFDGNEFDLEAAQ